MKDLRFEDEQKIADEMLKSIELESQLFDLYSRKLGKQLTFHSNKYL